MRTLKLLIVALLVSMASSAQTIVQPMRYNHYSFTEQVNIGVGVPQATLPSAYLQVGPNSGGNKGFLPPRLTTVQRDAISAPATGLSIYNTTTNKHNFYSGSAWVEIGSGSTNLNVGLGYRLAIPNTNNIKTIYPGYGFLMDSATLTNVIVEKVDTTTLKDVFWSTDGNSYPVNSARFGTTNGASLQFITNNVGSGRIDPLDVGSVVWGYNALANYHHAYSGGIVAIGPAVLKDYSVVGPGELTAIGMGALRDNRTGFRNTIGGEYAMFQGWGGEHNSGWGTMILEVNSGASYNSAFGSNALRGNKQGNYNSALGFLSLLQNTTTVSVSINTAGSGQTDGVYALTISPPESGTAGTTSTQAVAYVTISGGAAVSVSNANKGSGYSTEKAPVTATLSGAGGTPATFTVTLNSGDGNTGIGHASGAYNRDGDYNVFVGQNAGQYISNTEPSVHNSGMTFLGANASSIPDSGLINSTAIGYKALVGASNSLILGDTLVSTKVGIGTAYPEELLHVKGNIKVSGQVASTKQTVTYGTTTTWNWNAGTNAEVTLTGNITTFTITNAVPGTYATIRMIQDGTGSRLLSALPTGSKVFNGGAGVITLSTAASSIDLLTVFYDGTNYYWNYAKNYN